MLSLSRNPFSLLGIAMALHGLRVTTTPFVARQLCQPFLLVFAICGIGACTVACRGGGHGLSANVDGALPGMNDNPASSDADGGTPPGRDNTPDGGTGDVQSGSHSDGTMSEPSDNDGDGSVRDERDGMMTQADDAGVDADVSGPRPDETQTDCSWEAVFPVFGTRHLHAIWGSASNDVYAVGDSGTMLHYDGRNWTKVATNTPGDLVDIWGTGADDIYVVGGTYLEGLAPKDNITLHFDGHDWTEVELDYKVCSLTTVFGTARDNVFVAGKCNQIWRFDGSRWTTAAPPDSSLDPIWSDVFGCGAEDVFAISTNGGVLYRFDGVNSQFQPESQGEWPADYLHGVGLCAAPEDIWLISDEFYILSGSTSNAVTHWNGESWRALEDEAPETAGQIFTNMFITPDNRRYLVGKSGALFHSEGSIWTPIPSGTQATVRALWGASSDQLFAVGDLGMLLKIDGDGVQDLNAGVDTFIFELLTLGSDGLAAITNRGQVVIGGERQWDIETDPVLASFNATTASGTRADDILIGGSQNGTPTLLRFNGEGFELINVNILAPPEGPSCTTVRDLQYIGDKLFALCDNGDVIQQDGDRFHSLVPDLSCAQPRLSPTPSSIPPSVVDMSMWGDTPDNIFVWGSLSVIPPSGRYGTLDVFACHYNGSVWTDIAVDSRLMNPLVSPFEPPPRINAVWGTAADLYVLYTMGWPGAAQATGLSWASCNMWIEHHDGLTWTLVAGCGVDPNRPNQTGNGDWDFSGMGSDVFTQVGGGFAHFDGTSWEFVPFWVDETAPWRAGTSATGMYTATAQGTIYHRVCSTNDL